MNQIKLKQDKNIHIQKDFEKDLLMYFKEDRH